MHEELVLSGWWRRVGAALIDGGLTTAVTALILWPFGFDLGEYFGGEGSVLYASRAIDVTFVLVDAVVGLAYFTPMMVAWEGRTLGKRALAIRVVRADRQRLDAGTVVVRQVLVQHLAVALLPVTCLVNYLLPLADRENRAGHDWIARTRVVRDPR